MKNSLPVSNEEVLNGNPFVQCSTQELCDLWRDMRSFYANGYIREDSSLVPYQEEYINAAKAGGGLGLVSMELDLLRCMAVRYVEGVEK